MRRALIVVGLVALGWVAGRAQTAKPDFELVISGAAGDTQVKCVKGCKLSYQRYSGPNGPIYSEGTTDRVGFGCARELCELFAAGFIQK